MCAPASGTLLGMPRPRTGPGPTDGLIPLTQRTTDVLANVVGQITDGLTAEDIEQLVDEVAQRNADGVAAAKAVRRRPPPDSTGVPLDPWMLRAALMWKLGATLRDRGREAFREGEGQPGVDHVSRREQTASSLLGFAGHTSLQRLMPRWED